jgi:hypothetical protein
VINVIPKNTKATNKKTTVYSPFKPNKLSAELEKSLKELSRPVRYALKDTGSIDIKLKYSFEITEDEKSKYDIYNLSREKLYVITSKDVTKDISLEDIKQAFAGGKSVEESLIVFSPFARNWFVDVLHITSDKAYQNDRLSQIVYDDSTITGIVFSNEVEDNYKDYTKLAEINGEGIKNSEIYLCLLVKKDLLENKTSKAIVENLQNSIKD